MREAPGLALGVGLSAVCAPEQCIPRWGRITDFSKRQQNVTLQCTVVESFTLELLRLEVFEGAALWQQVSPMLGSPLMGWQHWKQFLPDGLPAASEEMARLKPLVCQNSALETACQGAAWPPQGLCDLPSRPLGAMHRGPPFVVGHMPFVSGMG